MMPRFFIDTSDRGTYVPDKDGRDFDSVEAAKAAAVAALPDMARDSLPDGDERLFMTVVSDEHGRTLLQASLRFQVTPSIPDRTERRLFDW